MVHSDYHYKIALLDEFSDEDFDRLIGTVSHQRQEKALAYKFASGRKQSLLAYLTLKDLLKEHFGITENPIFKEEKNGKPVILGREDIHFNMSHCSNAVACVVSRKPVGIDVEAVGRKANDDLYSYVLNAEEEARVREAENKEVEFLRFWTMKEAFVKTTGEGVSGKEQLQGLLKGYTITREAPTTDKSLTKTTTDKSLTKPIALRIDNEKYTIHNEIHGNVVLSICTAND